MTHANFERVTLDRVYPPFVVVSLEVIARCVARGVRYVATHGFRDLTEQAELRRLYLAGKGGKASPAGLSAHNYGLAFDFVCDWSPRPGVQPDWREAAYRVLGEESAKAGLVWGGRFGDSPPSAVAGLRERASAHAASRPGPTEFPRRRVGSPRYRAPVAEVACSKPEARGRTGTAGLLTRRQHG